LRRCGIGHPSVKAVAITGRRDPPKAEGDSVIPLLLLIILILVFGIVGAIKVAAWVLLIALAAAVLAGFLGRSLLRR
jgi:uncharacterized membrane protein